MSSRIPFEVREAVVSVGGKCFWYKDPFRDFLLGCGVPRELYQRYSEESKFKIARHLLAELDSMGDDGYMIQRRIVTELCKLRRLPDDNVPDRAAGLQALRRLKELGIAHNFVVKKEHAESRARIRATADREAQAKRRGEQISDLRQTFFRLLTADEAPHNRGYALEDLLVDLFQLNEIDYRRPYKTSTEQIDGHFNYKGFDYLVEARWRRDPPSATELGSLKSKVDRKITSTRGLFLSIVGFRKEVVESFTQGTTSNIILMDGSDLTAILEGRISLTDALDAKIQKAAQEGIVFFPVGGIF